LHAGEIDGELGKRGLADVHVRVVESRHDESAVHINDTGVWAEPRFDVRSIDGGSFSQVLSIASDVGNRNDGFAANRDGAGPFVRRVHRFNICVR
jgi:hypothetical protein